MNPGGMRDAALRNLVIDELELSSETVGCSQFDLNSRTKTGDMLVGSANPSADRYERVACAAGGAGCSARYRMGR